MHRAIQIIFVLRKGIKMLSEFQEIVVMVFDLEDEHAEGLPETFSGSKSELRSLLRSWAKEFKVSISGSQIIKSLDDILSSMETLDSEDSDNHSKSPFENALNMLQASPDDIDVYIEVKTIFNERLPYLGIRQDFDDLLIFVPDESDLFSVSDTISVLEDFIKNKRVLNFYKGKSVLNWGQITKSDEKIYHDPFTGNQITPDDFLNNTSEFLLILTRWGLTQGFFTKEQEPVIVESLVVSENKVENLNPYIWRKVLRNIPVESHGDTSTLPDRVNVYNSSWVDARNFIVRQSGSIDDINF